MEVELEPGDLLKDPETGISYIFLGFVLQEGGKIIPKLTDGWYSWSVQKAHNFVKVHNKENVAMSLLKDVNEEKVCAEKYRDQTMQKFLKR